MKIAIVHDWLVTFAGAERVLAELINVFPEADLFSVIDFLSDADRQRLGGKRAATTFIQKLPFARTRYRNYLPLMPLAIEQLDLSAYDLVISSSHAVAKGVLTGPDQVHVSYVHSPIRYAWDLQHQYLRESGMGRGPKSWVARWLLHRMRLWDARTANGVDRFVCNSNFIARRISKVYGRSAQVVYPPVDTERLTFSEQKEDFYLTASRLVPYKRVDLIVEAFSAMPDRRLVVVGSGPEAGKVKRLAGANVELLGYQPDDVLHGLMGRARAFVFAAEEDFGIIPVEAQACGTPVIAYAKGGVLETVVTDGKSSTGVFFGEQTVSSLRDAVLEFERKVIRPTACRANAERFSHSRFRQEIGRVVDQALLEMSTVSGSARLG
jgi:glycosyltransferase involved in cell wall biosynthesis